MSATDERAAWTALIEGTEVKAAPKYGSQRTEDGYASKHEARTAAKLWALQRAGQITELQEQVRIELIPGKILPDGHKLRAVTYWADFTYRDLSGKLHVIDSKGFKTDIYKLKKHIARLLLGIEIEED